MRIVITRSTPVDPDPRIEKEASAMAELGHTVAIIGWQRNIGGKSGDEVLLIKNNEFPIRRLLIPCSFGGGFSNLLKFIHWNWALLIDLIKRRNEYDAIHACDFDTAIPALIARALFRKKLVYDIFDFYVDTFNVPQKLKGLIRWLELRVIKHADAVILAGEDRVDQIGGVKPKALSIILNTPDDQLVPSVRDEPDILKLIYVGVLVEHRFLEEMITLVANRQNTKLTLAGWGPISSRVVDAATKYPNINYLGRIDYDKALSLTAEADLNFAIYDPIIPNHRFSNPNKVYEAMLLGRPVIVARGMGIDVLVEQEGCGFIVNYHAPSEVGELLDTLASSRSLLRDYGRRGREAYESRYSWALMKERLKHLYDLIS